MSIETLTVALVSEVFPGAADAERLTDVLGRARAAGAQLAVLPELPLNPWSPAVPTPRADDAEPPGGPRQRRLEAAARAAGIAVLGGAIVIDGEEGQRYNTALLVTAGGALAASYRKVHLPHEEGFWEQHHYRPGDAPPQVTEALGFRLGLQVCSDVNRPVGAALLAAQGAEAILAPRATEAATFDRWRLVLQASALTGGVYVLSVPRPRAEFGVALGGPSIAISPQGEVLMETTAALAVVTLERAQVARARTTYPGYLAVPAGVYAEGWRGLASAAPAAP